MNGATVADLAARRNDEPTDDGLDDLEQLEERVIGDHEQLTLNVGGAKVSASELKLRGASLPVDGEFKKGQLVRFEVLTRIGEVHFADKVDSTGTVVGTTRRHIAKVESVQRLAEAE